MDARGFLFGLPVALNLNVPFVPVRKPGKLPGPTLSTASTKECGKVFAVCRDDLVLRYQAPSK